MKKITIICSLLILPFISKAQETKVVASVWDGAVVAGYVDDGAFVNFGGPSVKWVSKPYAIGFGMLPSLRIKEDKDAIANNKPKNQIIYPSLGAGAFFTVKHFMVQIPAFYNPKTGLDNGKWNIGLGIGYKF